MLRGQAFPSPYVSSDELMGLPGECKVVTIADVKPIVLKNRGGKDEHTNLMTFVEPDAKPLIFKPTNWSLMSALYGGKDSDEWRGLRIELYVKHDVEYEGGIVNGVRIRRPSGTAPAETPINFLTGNPTRPPAVLSWPQAVTIAAAAGIAEPALKIALQALGVTATTKAAVWTPLVHQIIAEQQWQPGDEPKHTGFDEAEESIPF